METITSYLRSLGIRRTDRVISIQDPSFNITNLLQTTNLKNNLANKIGIFKHTAIYKIN